MDESLLKFMTEENLRGPQVMLNDAPVLDCEPPSRISFFNDPDMLEGRMTKTMTVIVLIIALITILINLGVIVRIYKVIKIGGDVKPAFYFIGNLAISDFLVGFYVVIVFCIDLTQLSTEWRNKCCGFLTAVVVTACQETIWNIVLIAVDKYTFICHGLHYRSIVTKRRVWISIAVSWFTSLLIGFLPLFGMHEHNWCACNFLLYINQGFSIILFITAVILPIIIIFWMYSIILRLAIKVTRKKIDGTSSSSSGLTSVIRLSFKSSKSSNSTVSSKISNTSSSASSQNSSSPEIGPNHKADDDKMHETTPLKPKTYKSISGRTQLKLPTVVELHETDLTAPYDVATTSADSDSIDGGKHKADNIVKLSVRDFDTMPSKRGSYDLINGKNLENLKTLNPNSDDKSVAGEVSLQSYKQFDEDGQVLQSNNKTSTRDKNRSGKTVQLNGSDSFRSTTYSADIETESENDENTRKRQWRRKSYYKRIAAETKDTVQFLQKCRAIKPISLIMLCFVLTYVPFVIGTFAFKVQKEKNPNLFKALNNFLYFAVVLNSLMNPFVYAYGYKEFRIQTKNFKGIFGRDRRARRARRTNR